MVKKTTDVINGVRDDALKKQDVADFMNLMKEHYSKFPPTGIEKNININDLSVEERLLIEQAAADMNVDAHVAISILMDVLAYATKKY